jgi:hypothetical protein
MKSLTSPPIGVAPHRQRTAADDARDAQLMLAKIEASLRRAGQSLRRAARLLNGAAPIIERTDPAFSEQGLKRRIQTIQRAAAMTEGIALEFQSDD